MIVYTAERNWIFSPGPHMTFQATIETWPCFYLKLLELVGSDNSARKIPKLTSSRTEAYDTDLLLVRVGLLKG